VSRVEVTKLNQIVGISSAAAELNVAKLNMIVVLEPGDSGPDTSNKQGHVHAQIVRR
jgi:hypothetical protein